MAHPEFSVARFFSDGTHDYVCRFVTAAFAVNVAQALTLAAGADVQRIIITDGGDYTVFEWQKGKGVTFPTKEG